MKTKKLLLGAFLSLIVVSCSKENNTNSSATPITSEEVASNLKIDNIADDVLQIAESQSNETEAGRSTAGVESFLSNCVAGITTTQSGSTWTRTVDFGDVNCSLYNGNMVRGKIIITFTNDFTAATRTISYAFENFYHNDRHVEGNRTVVKTILPNHHPQATISLDMTLTTPEGAVYHRTGQRVREFTEGYNTPNILSDNVFSVSGNWSTVFPNGNTGTATISSPVIIKWSCEHPLVSGVINYARNNHTAVLDYGNGDCDNHATITINGVVHDITFGN